MEEQGRQEFIAFSIIESSWALSASHIPQCAQTESRTSQKDSPQSAPDSSIVDSAAGNYLCQGSRVSVARMFTLKAIPCCPSQRLGVRGCPTALPVLQWKDSWSKGLPSAILYRHESGNTACYVADAHWDFSWTTHLGLSCTPPQRNLISTVME